MPTAVLENGFAVMAGEMVVFNYDSLTREYLSQSTEYLPVGVSIPANSCTDAPPGCKKRLCYLQKQRADRLGIYGGSSG